MYQLLSAFGRQPIRWPCAREGSKLDSRIRTVLSLIERDIRRSPRPAALAKEANLSVSRLYDLFRQATGTVPARYVRARRFEKARYLLITTHLTVREIAEHVGIHDDSHFVRDFEHMYGKSPRAFRRAHERSQPGPEEGDQQPAIGKTANKS